MENSKYCHNCGKEIFAYGTCPDCNKYNSDYLEKELERRNKKPWINAAYHDPYYGHKPTDINHIYVCHTCKYFMYHPLTYCSTCPNKLIATKITLQDMKEQLKDYKEGY